MLFLSALASLSLGMLSDWRICGLTIFDSLDFLTANILMPVGGLLTSIFVGWRFERRLLRRELGIGGGSGADGWRSSSSCCAGSARSFCWLYSWTIWGCCSGPSFG